MIREWGRQRSICLSIDLMSLKVEFKCSSDMEIILLLDKACCWTTFCGKCFFESLILKRKVVDATP